MTTAGNRSTRSGRGIVRAIPIGTKRKLFKALRDFERRVRSFRRSDAWEVTLELPAAQGLVAMVRSVHRETQATEMHEFRYRLTSGWFIHTYTPCGSSTSVVRRLRDVDVLRVHLTGNKSLGELYGAPPGAVEACLLTKAHNLRRPYAQARPAGDWIVSIRCESRGVVDSERPSAYRLYALEAEHRVSHRRLRCEIGFDPSEWCYVFRRFVDGRPEGREKRLFSTRAFFDSVQWDLDAVSDGHEAALD